MQSSIVVNLIKSQAKSILSHFQPKAQTVSFPLFKLSSEPIIFPGLRVCLLWSNRPKAFWTGERFPQRWHTLRSYCGYFDIHVSETDSARIVLGPERPRLYVSISKTILCWAGVKHGWEVMAFPRETCEALCCKAAEGVIALSACLACCWGVVHRYRIRELALAKKRFFWGDGEGN